MRNDPLLAAKPDVRHSSCKLCRLTNRCHSCATDHHGRCSSASPALQVNLTPACSRSLVMLTPPVEAEQGPLALVSEETRV